MVSDAGHGRRRRAHHGDRRAAEAAGVALDLVAVLLDPLDHVQPVAACCRSDRDRPARPRPGRAACRRVGCPRAPAARRRARPRPASARKTTMNTISVDSQRRTHRTCCSSQLAAGFSAVAKKAAMTIHTSDPADLVDEEQPERRSASTMPMTMAVVRATERSDSGISHVCSLPECKHAQPPGQRRFAGITPERRPPRHSTTAGPRPRTSRGRPAPGMNWTCWWTWPGSRCASSSSSSVAVRPSCCAGCRTDVSGTAAAAAKSMSS